MLKSQEEGGGDVWTNSSLSEDTLPPDGDKQPATGMLGRSSLEVVGNEERVGRCQKRFMGKHRQRLERGKATLETFVSAAYRDANKADA